MVVGVKLRARAADLRRRGPRGKRAARAERCSGCLAPKPLKKASRVASLLGVIAGLLIGSGLIGTPSAFAQTAVTCAELPALFGTGAGAATSGEVAQLPAGVCTANLTATNGAAFTLEGANGGGTILEPAEPSSPILTNDGNDVAFALSGLTFTGTNGAPAVSVVSSQTAVTLSGDVFTDDLGGGAQILSTISQPTVISDSTFSGDTSPAGGAGLDLVGLGAFTVTGNTFTANAETGASAGDGGGGMLIVSAGEYTVLGTENPVVVTGDTFGGPEPADGNTAEADGAGALIALGVGQALTLTGNTFQNNGIVGSHTATEDREGAGLYLGLSPTGGGLYDAIQSGNTFIENTITETQAAPAPALVAAGAGEWVSEVKVQSTADHFLENRVAVNDGSPPEGGGLAVDGDAGSSGTIADVASFDAAEDLFSGNSAAAGGMGGAVFYGNPGSGQCGGPCRGGLTLDDSTLVGNSVDPGAGSDGGAIWAPTDGNAEVSDSIVYGNAAHPEITGVLSGEEYSDVCPEPGGATVPSDQGDICANPELNPDGSETTASPTVDAGSNALVPSGLTTDLAGNPRILASRFNCDGNLGPPTVDMGAFEATFKDPVPPCPLLPVKPVISRVSETASKWLESDRLAGIAKRAGKLPVGTTFRFTLSEAATVRFVFARALAGSHSRKRAVAAGTMSLRGRAGANRVRFYGRVSKHISLKPHAYTVVITATASGTTSKTHTLKFTIAPP